MFNWKPLNVEEASLRQSVWVNCLYNHPLSKAWGYNRKTCRWAPVLEYAIRIVLPRLILRTSWPLVSSQVDTDKFDTINRMIINNLRFVKKSRSICEQNFKSELFWVEK
jgi:hypothetical protein